MTDLAAFAEPFARFGHLLSEATAIDSAILPEPTAFSLGTVGPEGQPSVRIVLLKGFDERGFVFYTNFESRKGRETLARPRVAMCFHWQPLEQQVRIEGTAAPVSDEDADAYFASRVRASQVGAWASLQSQDMVQASDLVERVRVIEERFTGKPVPRPPHWSGFRVAPHRFEFWRGMPNRLHERHLYVKRADGWRTGILYP